MQGSSRICWSFSKFRILTSLNSITNVRQFAKAPGGIPSLGAKKGKALTKGPTLEKKVLPVETDPKRLATYVCGSCIYKEGEDIKLKPDNEYPEWLWSLRTGPAPPFEELTPDMDQYWARLKRDHKRRNNRLAKLKRI